MPSNLATANGLLKDVYEKGIENELNNETPGLDMFEEANDTQMVGRQYIKGVRVNRNRGGYWTAEGGTPPTAGRQDIQNFLIPQRYYHHAVQFSKQVMDATKTTAGALEDAMQLEMEGCVDDLRVQHNWAMWGDGRGIRAIISPGASSTTQTLIGPGGVTQTSNTNRFLNVDDYIGFVVPTTGALRLTTVHKITALPSSTTILIDPTANTTTNDYVVKVAYTAGTLAIDDTEFMHPAMGLRGLVDNGTYVNILHGLSRTSYPVLQSTVITSVGALSADVLQRGIDVAAQVGQARIDRHWVHPDTKRAYLALMEADRRYTAGDLKSPDAGTNAASKGLGDTGLSFGGAKIYQDYNVDSGVWYGLDTRSLRKFSGSSGWVDDDHPGSPLHMSYTQIDTFIAYYRKYINYAMYRPAQAFRLDGITTNVLSVHVV